MWETTSSPTAKKLLTNKGGLVMDIVESIVDKSDLCREILDDLPEWFGLPKVKENYIAEAGNLPMLACFRDQQPVGFMCIKNQTTFAAELYVLGVKRRFHRQGIGRALLQASIEHARESAVSYLTVKTLAATSADPHYAGTRKFYESVGFRSIEIFPTLWGAANPCLLMILPLRGA